MALPNYHALLRPLRDGVRGNVYQLCMLPPPQPLHSNVEMAANRHR